MARRSLTRHGLPEPRGKEPSRCGIAGLRFSLPTCSSRNSTRTVQTMKPSFLRIWAVAMAISAVAAVPVVAAERLVLVAGGGANTNTTAPVKATEAKLRSPFGVDFDAASNLYLVEMTGQRVRKLDKNGLLTVVAGSGDKGLLDGPGLRAQFNGIHNLA